LDLGPFRGWVPVEMLGNHPFPPVGDGPYILSLSPHSFFWFLLEPPKGQGA
jgi:maltose alpha-D-glucosyltransferase/alpha-amylase